MRIENKTSKNKKIRIKNDIECPIYMLESKKLLSVYRKNSLERYLENGEMVINSGFPTVNCRK